MPDPLKEISDRAITSVSENSTILAEVEEIPVLFEKMLSDVDINW